MDVSIQSLKSGTLDLERNEVGIIDVVAKSDNPGNNIITVKVSGSVANLNSTAEKTVILQVVIQPTTETLKGYILPGIGAIIIIFAIGLVLFIIIRRRSLRSKR